jgi:F-type H+-transporting ATPase subunit b
MSSIPLLAASAAPLLAQVVTVIVGFLIVMWILNKYAWSDVLKALDERRDTVRKQFDDLDARQRDLEVKVREYEERLKRIDDEARERLNKAVDEGRRIAAELTEKARQEAEAQTARAKQTIQIETDKARIQLRNEIVALTIGAAERLLKSELNDEKHRELVGSFIGEMQDRSKGA